MTKITILSLDTLLTVIDFSSECFECFRMIMGLLVEYEINVGLFNFNISLGRVLFPATAYLQLVWETLAMMKGPIFFDMNVEFEDIRFLRATAMSKNQAIELNIMVHTGTGQFEITENSTAVVTGKITECPKMGPFRALPPLPPTEFPIMQERDFYKELRLRGYHYSGAFRSVLEARGDGLYGKVRWDLNWISFMDCLLQINILSKDSRSLLLPTRYKFVHLQIYPENCP